MESNIIEKYDLIKRKEVSEKLIFEYNSSKIKDERILNEAIDLDDTNPVICLEMLKKNKSNKNIERFYDILTKEELNELGIFKVINYKDLYYNFLNFINDLELDEPKNADNNYEFEDFEKENSQIEIENNDDNLSESEFQNIFTKKQNYNINSVLIPKRYKVKNLKQIFKEMFDIYYGFLNYRNNYPNFKSEYYYYNMLRYLLENFSKLKYRRYIKKIILIKSLNESINLMKNNLIQDILIQKFIFYVINTQYHLEKDYLLSLIQYNPNEFEELYNNNNNLIIDKQNKTIKLIKENVIIENYDFYRPEAFLKKQFLQVIVKNNKFNSSIRNFYGIKGMLLDQPFKKEDGDKYWDEFLSNNILKDIVQTFYPKIDNFSIFDNSIIKNIFKESSNYFPNYNTDFLALTSKDILMMYFPKIKAKINEENLFNSEFNLIIERALNKNNIHHEWGHFGISFLFYSSKSAEFNSPKRKIIKVSDDESEDFEDVYEGGEQVEKLLYNRVIEEITIKEALYILDNRNYKKSLENYRKDFIDVNNKDLKFLFENIINNNEENEQCILDGYNSFLKSPEYFSKKFNEVKWSTKKGNMKKQDIETFHIKIKRKSHHGPHLYKSYKEGFYYSKPDN